MARLSHPSYVYTASFHPVTHSLVVTGGFDRVLRIWRREVGVYTMVQVRGGGGDIIVLSIVLDTLGAEQPPEPHQLCRV